MQATRNQLLDLAVANSFDVVAIRIENERPIVIFVIMRAQPGLSVVFSSGCERDLRELVYGFSVLGGKGDMNAGLRSASETDPEEGLSVRAIARGGVSLGVQAFDAEWTQCLVIKRLRPLDIADGNRYVIQHVHPRNLISHYRVHSLSTADAQLIRSVVHRNIPRFCTGLTGSVSV